MPQFLVKKVKNKYQMIFNIVYMGIQNLSTDCLFCFTPCSSSLSLSQYYNISFFQFLEWAMLAPTSVTLPLLFPLNPVNSFFLPSDLNCYFLFWDSRLRQILVSHAFLALPVVTTAMFITRVVGASILFVSVSFTRLKVSWG